MEKVVRSLEGDCLEQKVCDKMILSCLNYLLLPIVLCLQLNLISKCISGKREKCAFMYCTHEDILSMLCL